MISDVVEFENGKFGLLNIIGRLVPNEAQNGPMEFDTIEQAKEWGDAANAQMLDLINRIANG